MGRKIEEQTLKSNMRPHRLQKQGIHKRRGARNETSDRVTNLSINLALNLVAVFGFDSETFVDPRQVSGGT